MSQWIASALNKTLIEIEISTVQQRHNYQQKAHYKVTN